MAARKPFTRSATQARAYMTAFMTLMRFDLSQAKGLDTNGKQSLIDEIATPKTTGQNPGRGQHFSLSF